VASVSLNEITPVERSASPGSIDAAPTDEWTERHVTGDRSPPWRPRPKADCAARWLG
jgi:hypothetical protein